MPPRGTPPRDADDAPFTGSVGFLLSQLGYLTSRGFRQLLAPLGLEPRQFAMLRHISLDEGRSQHALGEALHIPPSRMVALVDDLEGRGLLERRLNPADRRTRALHLTAKGRRLLERAVQTAQAHEQRVCGGLTPAQRRELLRLLNTVARDLGLAVGVHPAMAAGHHANHDPEGCHP